MSGFAVAILAIDKFFTDGWAARTPIAYSNGPAFEPPAGAAWVRLNTVPGQSIARSLGPSILYRWPGVTYVQIFTPLMQGQGDGLALADAAAAIFREQTFTTSDGGVLRFRAPSLTPVGGEGQFWQVNVACPFQRDRAG
jgi:hypothetical protein